MKNLQRPQRRPAGILHLIKQLVLAKGKNRNQLSSAHTHAHAHTVKTRLEPHPHGPTTSSTHPCLRASLMKPFL